MADEYGLKESRIKVCPGIGRDVGKGGRDGVPMANRSFASFACERHWSWPRLEPSATKSAFDSRHVMGGALRRYLTKQKIRLRRDCGT